MSLLPTFFIVLVVLCTTLLILATMPTRAEREIVTRITDIRNPRRTLNQEADGIDLDQDDHSTLTSRVGRYLKQYSFAARLEQLLLEADSPRTVGMFTFLSVRFALVIGIVALLFTRSWVVAPLVGAVGWTLPWFGLRYRRSRRLKAVTVALPDTADLMARALRAGHSVTQAIEVMAERAPQPLAAEFGRVFQQQKLGVALRDVLVELGRRVPSKDLHFLITAILVQRETGGDLAEILNRTTEVLRERIRVQGEVQVQTAQGRMTGWILSLMPVGLLGVISVFSPGYSSILFTDPIGHMLLYGAAISILIGGLIIRKIVQVNF